MHQIDFRVVLTILMMIMILLGYLLFSRIHLHGIFIEQFRTMKKIKKISTVEEIDEKKIRKNKNILVYNWIEIILFYIVPVFFSIIFFLFFLSKNKTNSFNENIGNISTIITIFCGFLMNAVLFIDSLYEKTAEKKRKEILSELSINTNYTLLVGFSTLIFILGYVFFSENLIILFLIITLLIHFVFGVLLVFNIIFSLNNLRK